jgi:tRNA modification GTPase
MYQYQSSSDTIAAIATAPGAGGIAIVRLSGRLSGDILGKVFEARHGKAVPAWVAGQMHVGRVKDLAGASIDEALAVIMRAPKSYTAEDVAEIQVHGGPSSARMTLELCLHHGARLADPGEFTRRAFLNGRMDLAQAEAVQDIVSARTAGMQRAAQHQLSGELSRELALVRETLMAVYVQGEALLNFPEDDTERRQSERATEDLTAAAGVIDRLLSTADSGMALREGVRLVIGGKPNAGKSSLLNALLKHSRAIVTDIAGTTRDTLEESASLKGFPVILVDTAGILEPRDKVEEESVRRSHHSFASADIILLVLDRSRPLDEVDKALLRRMPADRRVVVLNKKDLPAAFTAEDVRALSAGGGIVEVSALTRDGIDILEDALVQRVTHGVWADPDAVMLTNVRHVEALRAARAFLGASLGSLRNGAPGEIIADGIKAAVNRLDAITGRDIDADALERIFSSFCIGK